MKNNKGFAPIVIILAIVIAGGATYAVVQRSVLKGYFQVGDKPSEKDFADTIDSSLNLVDDGDLTETKVYNPTKAYIAGDTVVKSDVIYQAKALGDVQEKFTLKTAQPVTFQWTPVVPKPQEPVTYRLRVWQLMQGQSSSEAMRTNQPIVTKDVDNITQATVSGIYTGPCKPPYLCDFVWSVEVKGNRESARPSVIDVSVSSATSTSQNTSTTQTTETTLSTQTTTPTTDGTSSSASGSLGSTH